MVNKPLSEVKIAISGKSGCGNTTVSHLLAKKLNLRLINFTFRNLAEEKGLTLEEVLNKASSDDSWDKEVDSRQVAMAEDDSKGGCVLGSRLAIWMLKNADLKVYIKADPEIRIKRILQREGGDITDIAQFTKNRDAMDHNRYLQLYNIDNDDYSFADMIIDSGIHTPEEIVNEIENNL